MHAAVRYTVCVNVLRESGEYELAAGYRTDMALLSVQHLKKKRLQHLQLVLFMTLCPDLLSFGSSCFSSITPNVCVCIHGSKVMNVEVRKSDFSHLG